MQLCKFIPGLLLSGAMAFGHSSSAGAEGNGVNDPQRIDVLNEYVDDSGITTGSIIKDSEMLSYCINISDVASEARNSILKKKLETIESDVDKKLLTLEEKIAELEMWSKKRERFLENVSKALVQIFETMRPDAAALQFTEIGPILSSAIILKLDPKKSSAILTEMSPADAAKVAVILSSALEVKNEKTN